MSWLSDLLGRWRRPPKPPPAPQPPPAPGGGLAAAVNAARAAHGLPALREDVRLGAAAAAQAAWMARTGRLSHTGQGGTQAWDRARAAGYPSGRVAENIALGYADAAACVAGWLASPGHRANLLGGYADLGAAQSGAYYCADFGGP